MSTKTYVIVLLSIAGFSMTGHSAIAQEEPPRPTPRVTGSIGLDGTIDTFETETQRAIVKTAEGVRHVFHLTRRTVVHGAKGTGEDTFDRLDTGTHVVVQYVTEAGTNTAVDVDRIGEGGLRMLEGAVTRISRDTKTMAVQLADGSEVSLRLTERAARDAGRGIARADRVVVYYADEGGHSVAHYFKNVTTRGWWANVEKPALFQRIPVNSISSPVAGPRVRLAHRRKENKS